ncbi:MAG TPA: phosphate signaling complex protein PhoU [Bacteroidota bacterium]|nr:phosphate signaling complex protein PhoU [Bacteroidota bacterium]
MHRHFEIELDQLRTNIIKMGSLVDEQIDLATAALIESNPERARLVIERDKKVDEFDNLIDQQCERIFVLTQPVAMDLRLIMAALKINHELERMGDIAVNIAERAIPLQYHIDLLRKSRVIEMSSISREMVKRAIDSFVNNDPELAREILPKDDLVDNLNRDIFNFLVQEMKSDPAIIEQAAHIIVLSRHLERLADHATNIGEDVVYLVDAKIVKHHAEQSE